MAIENIPGGSLVITGEHITLYQLLAMRGALKLEILGIKMTRGRAVSVGIRQLLVHPARDKRTSLRGARPMACRRPAGPRRQNDPVSLCCRH
jgi:hypothetical protein